MIPLHRLVTRALEVFAGMGRAWRTLNLFTRTAENSGGTARGVAVFFFDEPSMTRISAASKGSMADNSPQRTAKTASRQCGMRYLRCVAANRADSDQVAPPIPTVIASPRVGAVRRPRTGSAKQSRAGEPGRSRLPRRLRLLAMTLSDYTTSRARSWAIAASL